MRLLKRLRGHGDVFESVEAALEADGGLGPERLHDPDALDEAGDAVLRIEPEGRVLGRACAEADAHGDAAAAELVEAGE